jgi:hypothetical protein
MSSIAKANISLSKKDLTKSRIPPVASRNVIFYHKATLGDLSINLLALSMPSAEMPTATQATNSEISGAQLIINKKNLDLTSSSKGKLIQDLDYIVIDSYTISLTGPYIGIGAEVDEIFVGIINSAPVSDLVVASAKSVDKTYELAIGSTILNLGREYKVGENPSEDVGSIKVFVNGILALRGIDYNEVDSGNGYGTTIQFAVAPVGTSHQVAVDFGVMSITDNNAIGAIENLAGSIKKIADDLAVVAGTAANDYYSASPSEVERRTFGDTVLSLNSKYDTTQALSEYTKTKWQVRILPGNISSNTTDISSLRFINLVVGRTYKLSMQIDTSLTNNNFRTAALTAIHNGVSIAKVRSGSANTGNEVNYGMGTTINFTASATTLTFNATFVNGGLAYILGDGTRAFTFVMLEELPNHEETTQWT